MSTSPTEDAPQQGTSAGVHTALGKYACPACGAEAVWNPARRALLCPYCGTEAPGELDPGTGEVRESDLVRALRELPDERRGWAADKHAVRCKSCNAVSVFDAGRVGQRCEFCGSSQLVDYEELKPPLRPEGLLPFEVPEATARAAIGRWLAGRWFAPGKLRSQARLEAPRGIYIPYWTFDARADCPWTADSGTYYYTTESYRDAKGRSQTRQVRHVRWTPAAGRIQHAFDDEPVPGTQGLAVDLLRGIEPFPTTRAVPYDTGYLAGFVVEHYQVVLVEAARRAREAMDQTLTQMCASQVPGDTHQNLRIDPSYDAETFKLVLVPVWVLAYRFGGSSYQVVVNGCTGTVAGRWPKSVWKIAAAVSVALLVATLLVFLLR